MSQLPLVENVSPAWAIQAQADMAIPNRLDAFGMPKNPGNDYERHLFARFLKRQGISREEVKKSLYRLGLEDIPLNKRESYVQDILRSIIVGFEP